jgi:hypothetical protein
MDNGYDSPYHNVSVTYPGYFNENEAISTPQMPLFSPEPSSLIKVKQTCGKRCTNIQEA